MREEKILAYLKAACVGKRRVIRSTDLEHVLNISGTDLRKHVNSLRRKGIPIASSREGYFYAATAGEIYATIRQLQIMERGLQAAIRGLESALDHFSADNTGGGDP